MHARATELSCAAAAGSGATQASVSGYVTLVAGGGALIAFCFTCGAFFVNQFDLGPAVARKLHVMGNTSPLPPPPQPPLPLAQAAQPPTQLAQPARPPA